MTSGVIETLSGVGEPPSGCSTPPHPAPYRAGPPAWGWPGDDWSVGQPVGTPEPLIVTELPRFCMPLSSACDGDSGSDGALGVVPAPAAACPPPPAPPAAGTEDVREGLANTARAICSYVPRPPLRKQHLRATLAREQRGRWRFSQSCREREETAESGRVISRAHFSGRVVTG